MNSVETNKLFCRKREQTFSVGLKMCVSLSCVFDARAADRNTPLYSLC